MTRRAVPAALAALALVGLLGAVVLVELRPPATAPPSARRAPQTLSRPIEQAQRSLNQTLSRQVRAAASGGAPLAVAAVLGLSFLYGVVHAVGPGHGKVVVASLFLGREARPLRGVATGFLISFLQIVSSTALVSALVFVLGRPTLDVMDRTVAVELVSYGLIATIGLYMLAAAALGWGHHREPTDRALDPAASGGPAPSGLTTATVLAAGLTPCPSAIIVLLFALASGVFALGIAASLVMAVGMGLTVSAVGLTMIAGRRALLRPFGIGSRSLAWTARALTIVAGAGLAAVGGWLAVGAWNRLP